MSGSVYTFTGNSSTQNGDAALETSQGWVALGRSGLFLPSEVQVAEQEGAVLVAGPALSPASALTAPTVAAGSTGTPTGAYRCCVTFVTAAGETKAGPEVSVTVTDEEIAWSALPVGSATSGVTARKLYRTAAAGESGTEKLVTTIDDNTTTTYTDNVADGSLGAVLPTSDTSAVVVNISGFEWEQPPPGATLGAEGI